LLSKIGILNLQGCKKINQNKNIFIISHSRGHIIANTFCKLYNKNIIGYINIDGGEQYMLFEKNIDEWIKKYDNINENLFQKLFINIKNNNDNESYNIISKFIQYYLYKQYFDNKYNMKNINMLILNNIYNDEEISINDKKYIDETLKAKFNFNKEFENNKNTKSIYYVGKSHYLYFYDDVVNDIIDYVKKTLNV